MEILNLVLNIVLVITAVITIVLVLVQKTKSSGLGAAFGGESASVTPKAKTASREVMLQRLTVILGIVFAVLALAITVLNQFMD